MYLNCRITFTCVNKIEAMYESPQANVKAEPHSTFTSIRCLSPERYKGLVKKYTGGGGGGAGGFGKGVDKKHKTHPLPSAQK